MVFLRHQFKRWIWNPEWRTIAIVGNAPILGVSITTIVVVPLLSKAIHFFKGLSAEALRQAADLNPHSDLSYFYARIYAYLDAHLVLPHVLQLLAFSAMFALIGKVIYAVFCPTYLKYNDFTLFRYAEPEGLRFLADDFVTLWNDPKGRTKLIAGFSAFDRKFMQNDLTEPLSYFSTVSLRTINTDELLHSTKFILLLAHPEYGEPFFFILRDVRDSSWKLFRWLCACSYYVALFFAGKVILIQGKWVLIGVGLLD